MFITLEGPDGSGKSSQIEPLAEYLRQQGCSVITTREPGGTSISNQVRDVLKSMDNKSMHPRTEILLFCAARAQLVEEVICPALEKGMIVLSDRYADSTLAYQGYGPGYELDFLRSLLNFATGGLWPDQTLYLDDYALAFHRRVRQGYVELAAQQPQRWVTVDAGQPMQVVQQELRRIVTQRLKK